MICIPVRGDGHKRKKRGHTHTRTCSFIYIEDKSFGSYANMLTLTHIHLLISLHLTNCGIRDICMTFPFRWLFFHRHKRQLSVHMSDSGGHIKLTHHYIVVAVKRGLWKLLNLSTTLSGRKVAMAGERRGGNPPWIQGYSVPHSYVFIVSDNKYIISKDRGVYFPLNHHSPIHIVLLFL